MCMNLTLLAKTYMLIEKKYIFMQMIDIPQRMDQSQEYLTLRRLYLAK